MLNVCKRESMVTPSELRVLELVRQGLTNREIARTLCRSELTIKTHVQRMLAKTGARNRAQLCILLSDHYVTDSELLIWIISKKYSERSIGDFAKL